LVIVVEATEAVICLAQGDFVGAGISLVSGVVDVVTCGAGTAIIEAAEEISKSTAKEVAI
jgi:hypothetical protein